MDFSTLEIFLAVAETRSVTRAAEQLGRVPSNVTTRLRQLEEDLGAALFLREGKRMDLTAEGRTYLDFARRILSLGAEARGALNPSLPTGRLRIGAMESTAASRLPAPLAAFHSAWPEVDLDLKTGTSRALVADVLGHALECALVASLPGEEGYDPCLVPELESHAVFEEELMLVLPARHPPVRTADDLEVKRLAALEAGCTYRRIVETWVTRSGLGERELRPLELRSYHAILACIAAGGCLGVVPRSVLALQPAMASISCQPLATVPTLLIRRRGFRSAACDAFLATLRAHSTHSHT
ncbi:LysR family transcriptional regulator [Roseixanthobacter glucoisosaccharinicivorans]|uniref:LysR family transcriptional regulator n=1 Tax=Roseixanthobacter glucoisosaccharinicivorans TaxID=3119923 RepID=UPI00372AC25B